MADNRKYYYLKLKENFFDSDSIVLLEDMKDGILYAQPFICDFDSMAAEHPGRPDSCFPTGTLHPE